MSRLFVNTTKYVTTPTWGKDPDSNYTYITYNFPKSVLPLRENTKTDVGYSKKQQELIKKVLGEVEKFHLVKFVQVPDNNIASIYFIQFRFSQPFDILTPNENNFIGLASYPTSIVGSRSTVKYGLLGSSERAPLDTLLNPFFDPGPIKTLFSSPQGESTLLHELGHSLGLYHTHPYFKGMSSIMSYDASPNMKRLGPVDHACLDKLYGSRVDPKIMGFDKENNTYYIPSEANDSVSWKKYIVPTLISMPGDMNIPFGGFLIFNVMIALKLCRKRFANNQNTDMPPQNHGPQPQASEESDIENSIDLNPRASASEESDIENSIDLNPRASNVNSILKDICQIIGFAVAPAYSFPFYYYNIGISDMNASEKIKKLTAQYTFLTATKSLGKITGSVNGYIAGWALNALIDPTRLPNMRTSIRLLRCFTPSDNTTIQEENAPPSTEA